MYHLTEFDWDCQRDAKFITTLPYNASNTAFGISYSSSQRHLSEAAANTAISAIIVTAELANIALEQSNMGVVVSSDPRHEFFSLHNMIAEKWLTSELKEPEICEGANVSPYARLSKGCVIEANATVSDLAYIGPGVLVKSGAHIAEGALIGVAGHFNHTYQGHRMNIQHVGRVVVQNGVQVKAGAIVQRDVYAVETQIGRNSVIGPGVGLGHGVNIGENTVIAGGCLIAGYTQIGDNVWIGPNSTVANKLHIERDCRIEIGSVVINSLQRGHRVSGNFALSHFLNVRSWAKKKKEKKIGNN